MCKEARLGRRVMGRQRAESSSEICSIFQLLAGHPFCLLLETLAMQFLAMCKFASLSLSERLDGSACSLKAENATADILKSRLSIMSMAMT